MWFMCVCVHASLVLGSPKMHFVFVYSHLFASNMCVLILMCLCINDCYVPYVCCICSPLQISESFKSFGMSDESRNVLVVTFEDSANPVKVCTCVHACVCVCVCTCVCACACVCVCWSLDTGHIRYLLADPVGGTHRLISDPTKSHCFCLCLILGQTHEWEAVKAFGHSTQCNTFVHLQFLTVKEVIKGEMEPLDQLPHCHDVDGIIKVCMQVYVCVCLCVWVHG